MRYTNKVGKWHIIEHWGAAYAICGERILPDNRAVIYQYFQPLEDATACPKCKNHEDLPLILLRNT